MPLSTVLATKDTSPIVPQPLLLARFRFVDGSYLYLSTHPLNSTEGGYQYGGNNYLARLDSQDITQFGRSEQGIDRVPSVTFTFTTRTARSCRITSSPVPRDSREQFCPWLSSFGLPTRRRTRRTSGFRSLELSTRRQMWNGAVERISSL